MRSAVRICLQIIAVTIVSAEAGPDPDVWAIRVAALTGFVVLLMMLMEDIK